MASEVTRLQTLEGDDQPDVKPEGNESDSSLREKRLELARMRKQELIFTFNELEAIHESVQQELSSDHWVQLEARLKKMDILLWQARVQNEDLTKDLETKEHRIQELEAEVKGKDDEIKALDTQVDECASNLQKALEAGAACAEKVEAAERRAKKAEEDAEDADDDAEAIRALYEAERHRRRKAERSLGAVAECGMQGQGKGHRQKTARRSDRPHIFGRF